MKHRIQAVGTIFVLVGCLILASCNLEGKARCGPDEGKTAKSMGLVNSFFAMDTGTKDAKHRTAKAQAEMLRELGYAGIGYSGFGGLSEMVQELDKNGLKLFTIYTGVSIDPDKQKYEPGLKEGLRILKGSDTIVSLTFYKSPRYKNSSPEGDARAVEIAREIADMAWESEVQIAFYPHVNTWLERVEDAVRVAKKVNRRNVGVYFNLYHWLKVDEEENMEPLMKLALPYLFVATINGSSQSGTIETLDRGSFDNYKFLKTLKELGYTGPIGLQGWGIKGDVYENLQRSMKAWRQLSQQITLR